MPQIHLKRITVLSFFLQEFKNRNWRVTLEHDMIRLPLRVVSIPMSF